MNKNEKILASIVVSLFLLIVIGLTASKVNKAFRTKRETVNRLEKDIRDKKQFDQFTQEHRDRMEVYKSRSLPSDPETARSLYQAWLMDRAVDEVGFADPKLKADSDRTSSEVYERLRFTITAKGDLQQMVEFLYKFYSVDYLHRVSRLVVKRTPGTKQLDLTFTVDALSLPTAINEGLSEEPSNRLAHEDSDAYRDAIVYRNLFGPPNNEPTLDSIDEIVGYKGRTVEFTVAGRDPDKLDKLIYRIEGDGLPDDCLDEDSGRFAWDPEKLGTVEVKITATDTGWPPKSVSQTATINVAEAPPEPEEEERVLDFASAKFAYVTGITDVDGRKQTFIHLRTEDKMLKLNEGDEFDIGEVTVTVKRISNKTVELEAGDLEKRLLVSLGQNLAEGSVLPSEEG
ncbi:MAG: hypothetical protein H8E44_45835 [Planctomycetes bacterium]|nr:hypothetical protein [Planctomycetota bacterium]